MWKQYVPEEVKWRKASMAALLWASLEDLQQVAESNHNPFTETEALNRGRWSGPSFMDEYVGNAHFFCWQSSCSLVLYIVSLSLYLSRSLPRINGTVGCRLLSSENAIEVREYELWNASRVLYFVRLYSHILVPSVFA